jgi:hypothetical protein
VVPHQGTTRHQQQNRKKILFHYLNDTKENWDYQIISCCFSLIDYKYPIKEWQ